VAVAAYVTTQARLKLYEYFSKLGEYVYSVIDWSSSFRKITTPESEFRGISGRPHG